jgi:Ni,Fe-hydrogenase I cytochrome b subunit
MNTTANIKPKRNIKEAVIEEAKKAFVLTLYLAVWFCALSFLAATLLDERPIPLSHFGFAFIKAAITAKFLLIGQAIHPITVNKSHGIFKSLFLVSLVYMVIVLGLNYLEAGVDGLIHGKPFLISMTAFGQDNPLRIVAVSIVYWLIVWPYLTLAGMQLIMGQDKTLELFFGDRSSATK